MKRAWVIGSCLCLGVGAWADDVPVKDLWSLGRLDGLSVGYVHEQVVSRTTKSGLRYVMTEDEVLKFRRNDQDLMIHISTRSLESADGTLVDFQRTTDQGGSPLITRGYRDGSELVVWEGGVAQRYPLPQGTLAPYAADLKTNAVVLKPGTLLSCLVFQADFPQHPVEVDREVQGQEIRTTLQGDQNLWKIKTNLDVMPGFDLLDWVNDKGEVVISERPFGGFGNLELETCTKEVALAPLQGKEIYNSSEIIPKKSLGNYRQWTEAKYHISGPETLTLYSGPEQTVVKLPDGSAEVTVKVPTYSESAVTWTLPAMITPELKPYLSSSTFMDLNDPGVQDLARQAVGAESNPLVAAKKIESFVQAYITNKDLSVGFASATDTAKSRTGDCTEHAVLAAALGRVEGLPTRLVIGVGYVPSASGDSSTDSGGVFGFHMWAEAYLGPDQWVAMDSALGGFDVGHIAFVKTDLATSAEANQACLPIMEMVGKLKIDVEETK